MKIEMNRSESKSMLGGIKFRTDVKFVPTSDEMAAIRKYNLGKREIDMGTKRDLVWGGKKGHSVNDLLNGISFETKSMGEMVQFEEAVTEAAQHVKGYINSASMQGREVIEV